MLLACWTPPSPGLVLLLCWPQQPRSAPHLNPRTRPCHAGTRARGDRRRLYFPMPAAARRPAAAGYPLACQRSRCSSDKGARPGMTHRDEQTCADVSEAPSLPTRRAPLRLASSCAGSAYLPVVDVRAGTALRVSYVAAARRSAASFAVRGHGRLAVRYGRRPTRRMLRRRPWRPGGGRTRARARAAARRRRPGACHPSASG